MKQAERTELTLTKILKAALEEFGVRGYACGSVNNICKSGINKGLIYHNFEDKDGLYLACLERSCQTLVGLIEGSNSAGDLLRYMELRMRFLEDFPKEAHIFFEAVLQPPEKLRERIQSILQPFEDLNERIYRSLLKGIPLREGVTEEDALLYFHQMQRMFNGYFSSASGRSLEEQILAHEMNLAKWVDLMLYGIAKGGTNE